MRERAFTSASVRSVALISAASLLVVSCTGDSTDDAAGGDVAVASTAGATGEVATGEMATGEMATGEISDTTPQDATDPDDTDPDTSPEEFGVELVAETGHLAAIDVLTGLLPETTRGLLSVDVQALLSGDPSTEIPPLLTGDGADFVFSEMLSSVGTLAGSIDVAEAMTTTDWRSFTFESGLNTGVTDGVSHGAAPGVTWSQNPVRKTPSPSYSGDGPNTDRKSTNHVPACGVGVVVSVPFHSIVAS